jgi:hypothetical protein
MFLGDTLVDNDLYVNGTLYKAAGAFRIDHPLQPQRMYLNHSFVESPDMKNIYDGVAVLDESGKATVTLPDWFEALNADFRYQLTPMGASFVPYVAEELAGNAFMIAGGIPGKKVSWQITGIRHDPYAKANRIQVEEPKPESAVGTYLHPEVYGQPVETAPAASTGKWQSGKAAKDLAAKTAKALKAKLEAAGRKPSTE